MLSRLMLVTDRNAMRPDFMSAIVAALEGGARLIQLREKDLPRDELWALSIEASNICRSYGGVLLISSDEHLARIANAGVHWPEKHLDDLSEYSKNLLSGASVHSVKNAQSAEKAGADYLVFGTVFTTTSHPDETPAGTEKLREVVANVSIPVYAIGGIDNDSIRACLETGAHGVAVRSAVWKARDVNRKVEELLGIIETSAFQPGCF